jgi:hypothetical protein
MQKDLKTMKKEINLKIEQLSTKIISALEHKDRKEALEKQ